VASRQHAGAIHRQEAEGSIALFVLFLRSGSFTTTAKKLQLSPKMIGSGSASSKLASDRP
jgi:hypothetical protein